MPRKTAEERAAELMEGCITNGARVAAVIREAEAEARREALEDALELAKGSTDPMVAEAIAALLKLTR
jgi:hypothetical protein